MKAARFYAPGDVRIDDIPEPQTGPREVKVRVAYNGICGTDLHEYFTGPLLIPVHAPDPRSGARVPVVMGHEAGGYVAEVGGEVDVVTVGDLVAIQPQLTCGTCDYCRGNEINMCLSGVFNGLNAGGGGLSEFTVVPAVNVHRMAPGASPLEAAIVEPMAVAYRAVSRARPGHGQSAVVHGAGPIGIGAFLALRRLGLDPIVVEPSPARRAAARHLGARHVVDPAEDSPVKAVMDLTRGRGADIAIDAVGIGPTFAAAQAAAANGATIVIVGAGAASLDMQSTVMFRELHVTGSKTYTDGDFRAVIAAIAAGDYPLAGWTTTVPLDDIVTQGFEPLHRGEEIKVMVEVSSGATTP